ncbi:hypothetical protein H5410_031003 [Solanum commersonii]|uniref:Uncharacterized protein n=1 Tax=Solanum commersonii TaxID=4109 RepID=A0A9J5YH84_SOLCO|nr:hypothetical protein H5410_031003 [Solanum commersonii]
MEDYINIISKGGGEGNIEIHGMDSFPNLLPTFFEKESLFSLASAVDLPKKVYKDIENEKTGEKRSQAVHIRYDYIPKYCEECKLQGYNKQECRILNPEPQMIDKDRKLKEKIHGDSEDNDNNDGFPSKPEPQQFQKGKARVLSNGKVVGDPRD